MTTYRLQISQLILVAKITELQLQHLQLFADLHLQHLRYLQHFAAFTGKWHKQAFPTLTALTPLPPTPPQNRAFFP
ncbi:MAG: hypothetical protein JNM70_00685 [Anaerolineae bacterium]|nr:hypothetical protein [Anaerolineae bacterium]